MINIDFDDYKYYPTLRSRQAELKGLDQLDRDRKSKILPMITLGRWPKAIDFSKAADKAVSVMNGLPFFMDLTNDSNHLIDQQGILRKSDDGFSAWREFSERYENAIPIIQITSESRARDLTRQAQLIERSKGKLGFRITDFTTETQKIINIISALDEPRNAIVFIDCQYIRNALAAYTTACISTINMLRTEFPELYIVVTSTSFPSSTIKFTDQSQEKGSIDILERELHQRVGGDSVAAYGDHSSIHSVIYDDTPIMRWAARIDYPRELEWQFERRPRNQSAEAYVSAAESIVDSDPEIGTRGIWGEEMIIQAAQGEPHAKAPAPWIAVRVNIHLARQIDFSSLLLDQDNYDDEIEDLI